MHGARNISFVSLSEKFHIADCEDAYRQMISLDYATIYCRYSIVVCIMLINNFKYTYLFMNHT